MGEEIYKKFFSIFVCLGLTIQITAMNPDERPVEKEKKRMASTTELYFYIKQKREQEGVIMPLTHATFSTFVTGPNGKPVKILVEAHALVNPDGIYVRVDKDGCPIKQRSKL